jgi:hypothetical protein
LGHNENYGKKYFLGHKRYDKKNFLGRKKTMAKIFFGVIIAGIEILIC